MKIRHNMARSLAASALGLTVAAGGLAAAGTAQAYDTGVTHVSCKAVKVHKSWSKNSTTVGIAYKGDKVVFDQWEYVKRTKTWWVRSKITRKSDGAKLRGYVVYQCANPYETTPAPEPTPPKK
ncbi:hypothetical protein [Streptomyces sp. NBC_01530]|uniref:hypothetical protein n=1 Tax=Streptomyces sp. NBC_01530 TaxID=2903895 RepID=UPI003869F0C1